MAVGNNSSNRHVRAAVPDDEVPHSYFVFADGRLLRMGVGSTQAEVVAEVPNILEVGHGTGDGRLKGKELEIRAKLPSCHAVNGTAPASASSVASSR